MTLPTCQPCFVSFLALVVNVINIDVVFDILYNWVKE
jgi:hypothetical protein